VLIWSRGWTSLEENQLRQRKSSQSGTYSTASILHGGINYNGYAVPGHQSSKATKLAIRQGCVENMKDLDRFINHHAIHATRARDEDRKVFDIGF
jgi:hypothetical protein